MAIPNDSKTILKALLGGYADQSGDGDLRLSIGTPGYRIQVRGEVQDTGQGYVVPGFIDGVLYAIGALMDRRVVDEFTVIDPLGQNFFTLSQAPRPGLFQAFRNRLLLKSSEYSVVGNVVNTPGLLADWFAFVYWF